MLTAIGFLYNSVLGAPLGAFPAHRHYPPLVRRHAEQNKEGGTAVVMRRTITKQRMERWR